jgi:hypothetical protein
MLASSLTFLTPEAAWLAPLALVPVAAAALAARRVAAVRQAISLPAPARPAGLRHELLLAAIVLLLVLAAMQPALRLQTSLRARTDAQVFVVLDTSRSMVAAPKPTGPRRLKRAKELAVGLGAKLGDVPVGVATFTDRVLPDLFPTADHAAFDSTLMAVSIEDPPPRLVATTATTFDALSALGTQGFFPDTVRKRVVIVVTDGESAPFDPAAVASALLGHGVHLDIVRVGGAADRVWAANGRPEAAYRPNPAGARRSITSLDEALGQRATGDPAAFVRRAIGTGPTATITLTLRERTLALVPVLVALVLLAGLFYRDGRLTIARMRTERTVRESV